LQKISSKARLNRMRQRAKEYRQANADKDAQNSQFNAQNNNLKSSQA